MEERNQLRRNQPETRSWQETRFPSVLGFEEGKSTYMLKPAWRLEQHDPDRVLSPSDGQKTGSSVGRSRLT